MGKKMIGLAAALVLLLGITSGVAPAHECKEKARKYAEHQVWDKRSSFCSKKRCILKQRKECICCYLRNSDELGLSEEQVAKLKKLQREAKTVKIRNKAERKIIKLEIHALLDEKKPDLSAIDAKIDECSKLKAAAKKACIHAAVKAREVLTEEQFKLSKKLGKSCDLTSAKPHHPKGKGHHSKKH